MTELAGETAGERGLLAGGGVAVDDALGDGLVERTDRLRDAGALLGALGRARDFTAERTCERTVRLRRRRRSFCRIRLIADFVFAT